MYDEAKRFSEALIYSYNRQLNVNTGILRIFNTYGPGMDLEDGRVIPAFINALKTNRALPIAGDGEQTRSFCYIDDLIEGIMLFMSGEFEGPMNVGNDSEYSINELVEVFKLYRPQLQTQYIKRAVDDPTRRRPDLTKAFEMGYKPTILLADGIKRMLEFYQV